MRPTHTHNINNDSKNRNRARQIQDTKYSSQNYFIPIIPNQDDYSQKQHRWIIIVYIRGHKLFHLWAACISLLLCMGRHILLRNRLHNMISNKTYFKILIILVLFLIYVHILHKKII